MKTMRTMLTIAFSLFAVMACAVEPEQEEIKESDEVPAFHTTKPFESAEQPIACATNLDCHAYGVHLACDLVTSRCVKIDLREAELAQAEEQP